MMSPAETFAFVMSEIQKRNWIYILLGPMLQASTKVNDIRGAHMNTIAITSYTPAGTGFAATMRRLGAALRRAFELSGTPYVNGAMPPL
jgi:hypothetical protein